MAPAMALRARPQRTRTLAERKKKALTRENAGAPGGAPGGDWLHPEVHPEGFEPPTFRSVGPSEGSAMVHRGPCQAWKSCVMILVDGVIVDRVAVSLSIM